MYDVTIQYTHKILVPINVIASCKMHTIKLVIIKVSHYRGSHGYNSTYCSKFKYNMSGEIAFNCSSPFKGRIAVKIVFHQKCVDPVSSRLNGFDLSAFIMGVLPFPLYRNLSISVTHFYCSTYICI